MATIDLTESAVMTGLRFFLIDVLPDMQPNNIRQGQQNRVPMPVGPNFIILTPTNRMQMSTNGHYYVVPTDPAPAEGSRGVQRSTQVTVQVDVYGPVAAENAQIIKTLLRDAYGCDFLRPYRCQPLYTGDSIQLPLISGEKQYEQRWTLSAVLQFNPTVSTSQQFADIVELTIVEADQYAQ